MTLRWLPVLAVLWLAFGSSGCGGFVRDKETAADAMDQFHDRYNAGDFGKIYDTADADFQASTTRTDWLKLMDAVHRKLGNYKTCASQGWKTNTNNFDTTVGLRYKSTFEKGDGTEDFVFHISGKRAELRSYHIDAPKLIID